jgi:hypothetical protein
MNRCGSVAIRRTHSQRFVIKVAAKAWKPQAFSTLVDVEPFWVAGKGLTMVRFRAGLGYIPSDRLRIEFVQYAQWGEATGSEA